MLPSTGLVKMPLVESVKGADNIGECSGIFRENTSTFYVSVRMSFLREKVGVSYRRDLKFRTKFIRGDSPGGEFSRHIFQQMQP